MRKTSILLTSMLLLVGCAESVAVIGTGAGAANGKIVQSSLQSAASLGIKQQTGKTPLGHAFNYMNNHTTKEKQTECSSLAEKKELENCSTIKEKIASSEITTKEKDYFGNESANTFLSLRSSINKKSKIKYLD
jgi:hypothetical protein